MITTSTSTLTNAERIGRYHIRLGLTHAEPMDLGLRAEAGLRYLRELAARPRALAQRARNHGRNSPGGRGHSQAAPGDLLAPGTNSPNPAPAASAAGWRDA